MGGCGQKRAWDSDFNKWINLATLLHDYIFKKAKSYFNSYWVGIVKHGCVLLGHRILKSAIPQLKNELMNWADFLHAGCDGSFCLEHESCSLSWRALFLG